MDYSRIFSLKNKGIEIIDVPTKQMHSIKELSVKTQKTRHQIMDDNFTIQHGTIVFKVATLGTEGPYWEKRLTELGVVMSGKARHLLHSPKFIPMEKACSRRVVIFMGRYFEEHNRTILNARRTSNKSGWMGPSPDLACLILNKFNEDDVRKMEHSIIVLHDPINDENEVPHVFIVGLNENGVLFLDAVIADETTRPLTNGFATVHS